MKKALFIAGVLLIQVLGQNSTFAEDVKIENLTLQKALESITPELTTSALSATFVRTIYEPQILNDSSQNQELTVKRTVISNIFVNSNGVKESLCDSRKVGSLISKRLLLKNLNMVKQYGFHFADDGQLLKIYDSRNKTGLIRKSPDNQNSNRLQNVAYPCAASNRNKYLSRAKPVLLSRLRGARVTKEFLQENYIKLEGEYANSDPEQYFEITLAPNYNYAIVEMSQYDKKRRILTSMSSKDFIQASGEAQSLWLPNVTIFRQYRYDDHEGNSVQTSVLDILEPILAKAQKRDFSFIFPSDAVLLYDQTIDVHINRDKIDKLDLAAMDDATLLSDEKGQTIISSAREKYKARSLSSNNQKAKIQDKKNNSTSPENKKEKPQLYSPLSESHTLQLPQSSLKPILSVAVTIILVCGATVAVVFYRRCKTKTFNKTHGSETYN